MSILSPNRYGSRLRSPLGIPGSTIEKLGCVLLALGFGTCLGNFTAMAQDSSLLHQPVPMGSRATPSALSQADTSKGAVPMVPAPAGNQSLANASLQNASWTYVPPQSARVLRLHDIVSIRVDELSTSTAQGNASSRKTSLYDANLLDWVKLDGFGIKPAPMTDGDPRVQGQENEVYRSTSQLQTRESMAFNIAAEIADIRPNGVIVLSAQKSIQVNDNVFAFSLTGLCRAEDIGPDNSIMSRHILDLQIAKNDRGHVRDAYSRGWFTRFIARIKPF